MPVTPEQAAWHNRGTALDDFPDGILADVAAEVPRQVATDHRNAPLRPSTRRPRECVLRDTGSRIILRLRSRSDRSLCSEARVTPERKLTPYQMNPLAMRGRRITERRGELRSYLSAT